MTSSATPPDAADDSLVDPKPKNGGTYHNKKAKNIRPKFQGISPENMA